MTVVEFVNVILTFSNTVKRLMAGLYPDTLGSLQRSHRPPSWILVIAAGKEGKGEACNHHASINLWTRGQRAEERTNVGAPTPAY